MRHAVFVRPGQIEWRETPAPRLHGAGEAIVRPIVVGRCDLDVAYVRGLLPLATGEPIGHEIIAEIVDIGEDAGFFRPGDRVFVPAQISCGECAMCRIGATGRCRAVPFAASYGMGREGGFGGGLADLVRVPYAKTMLTAIPSGADAVALIGLADMATDAWRGIGRRVQRMPDSKVLIIGGTLAVIGLYAVGIATSLNAPVVDYIDPDANRRHIASRYGARCLDITDLEPAAYDVIFVADPRRAALEAAFAAVAPGGSIKSATPTRDGGPNLDTASLYHRGVSWTIGRPDCRGQRDGTLHAWSCCGFDPNLIPTTTCAFEAAPEAWVDEPSTSPPRGHDEILFLSSRWSSKRSALHRQLNGGFWRDSVPLWMTDCRAHSCR